MKVIRKILKKIWRFGKKIYKKLKYEETVFNVKLKRKHYRLEKKGELTIAKKKEILTKVMQEQIGYKPDLKKPKTFNEKIAWLKLYYQNPLVTKCSDKYAVKEYLDDVLGEGYALKTLAFWNNPDDVDVTDLPKQFVLKVNWSSGYLIVVKDKDELDMKKVRKKLKLWMKPYRNSYYQLFNWGYKDMQPVIYAEEYIEQLDGQVYDYKFFCYNGEVKNLFIATDRFNDSGLTYNWFDRDYNPLPFTYGTKGKAEVLPEKPKNFERMIEVAEKLAKPFPFVRVDFYELGDEIYIGEMTFYSGGGVLKFTPEEWDRKLGDMLSLPEPIIYDKKDFFEPVSQRECYMLEDKIPLEAKIHYCEQKAYAQLGYFPNLDNPKSYNEKIMWLALHYKNEEIAVASDKADGKKWIADRVGEEYVVPTYGVYDNLNELDFDELPREFVIKSNCGWGSNEVKIIKDSWVINRDMLKAEISNWLYPWASYYYNNFCITEEKIKPKIVVEKYLKQGDHELYDYKFYCCNGEPKFALVVADRSKNQTRTFVDMDWNVIPMWRKNKKFTTHPDKPQNIELMKELAKKISKGFPLVRVDFYEIDGKVYVGEATFTPGMFLSLQPVKMDYKMGELLDLTELEAYKELHK